MNRLPQLLLWLFVVAAGIVAGGSIYEMVVLMPLWAGALPESLRQWPHGAVQAAFFAPATPLYALFALGLAIAARWMPRPQRRWALAAGLSGVLTGVWTFLFFVPILQQTQATAGAGLSDAEIVRLVDSFTRWHWGRWLLLIGGWLCGLRALSLSDAAPRRRQP